MATSAMAADMATKAPPAPAPAPSPWDVAITAALMSDYNFRGITQSAHRPSTQAGFEVRYTQSPMWQYYAGISGESIDFPNRAASEMDFYGGVRPTFDKLALDFGAWYYYYPGGQCFAAGTACAADGAFPGGPVALPNGNFAKKIADFYEVYGKATYTINDNWAVGFQEWYSPNVVNTGASGWYSVGNITYTAPTTWFTNGVGMYVSGDGGYWALGTSDPFYGTAAFPGGIKYTSYWNWDAGLGFTWKAFTLDLRYYDTNLNRGDCNAFTSDQTASGTGNVTAINPGGAGSNWCSATFIAKLSFATNLSNIK
ncbi:MAG TPA: TorF family putative porin [Xanthobacteraceae bacterium]|nr:TorF family putative porin [Xanthobacteraceae bacterium]